MQLPPGFPQFRRKVCANYFIHLTPKNSGRLALSEKIKLSAQKMLEKKLGGYRMDLWL